MNKYFIIFVLFVFVDYIHAYPLIRSSEYIGKGFNSKTGEVNAFPIFQLGYKLNQTWTFPGSTTKYSVPDEFEVRDLSLVVSNSALNTYETYNSYLTEFTKWYNFEFGIQTGAFTLAYEHINELIEIYQSITTDINMFSHSNYWWGFYHTNTWDTRLLKRDPYFDKVVKMLPRTINTQGDVDLYTEFINTFGTEATIGGDEGAKISINNFMDNEITHSQSFEWILDQTTLMFHFLLFDISPGDFKQKTDIKIDDLFLKHARTVIDFDGGDPLFAKNSTLDKWIETIEDKSTYLNLTFVPLWELITEDSVKQATLKDFISKYLTDTTSKILKYRVLKPNDNPIPGLDVIGCGLDTTTMENKDIIFLKTYDMGTTWTNPIYPDLVFDIPDYMFVQDVPEDYFLNATFIISSTLDFNAYYEQITEESSGFLDLGSTSTEVIKTWHFYYENDQAYGKIFKYFTWVKITRPVNYHYTDMFHPEFLAELTLLPSVYNNDTKQAFYDLFGIFGTTIVDSIYLGGTMLCETRFHKCFTVQESDEWVSEQTEWSFMDIIGDGHGHSTHTHTVDKTFTEYSSTDAKYVGGLSDKLNINQWKDWVLTIKDNMVPVRYTLAPLWDVIDDPVMSNNIKQAAYDYTQEAVNKANNLINDLKKKDPNIKPSWCTK